MSWEQPEHRIIDINDVEWIEWAVCPYCDTPLCTADWLDQFDPDDVVGCDTCDNVVAASDTTLRWFDEFGNES